MDSDPLRLGRDFRSNCVILLAGNGAFFAFSAQQILQGHLASAPLPYSVLILFFPMFSAIGIVASYVALMLPDFFGTYPNKHGAMIIGLIVGAAMATLTTLLALGAYSLVTFGFDAAALAEAESLGPVTPNP